MFADAVQAVRQHWKLGTILFVVVVACTFGFVSTQPKVYEATAEVFVSTSGAGADLSQLAQGAGFSASRVQSYTRMINSPLVMTEVINELHLNTTPTALAQKVVGSSPANTVMLDITASDTSPAMATQIANSVARHLPGVIEKLETPPGTTSSPVHLTVTRDAIEPTAPSSPAVVTDMALGIAVALVLALGAAFLRYRTDTRLRDPDHVASVGAAPALGALVEAPWLRERSIVVHSSTYEHGEGFRQLRTNIRFLSVDRKLTSFVVTSAVPGEGKSVIAANLAVAMAQLDERVVLIDGDLRRPQLAGLFGLPERVGLTGVLLGDVNVRQALQRWRDDLPLFVVTAGAIPPNPSELLGSSRLTETIDDLVRQGFTVIVDSAPLLPVTDSALIARSTDGALVVSHVGKTRVDQLSQAVGALRTAGADVLGVIANHVPRTRTGPYQAHTYQARSAARR